MKRPPENPLTALLSRVNPRIEEPQLIRRASGAASRCPQSVPVGVFKVTLAPSKTVFIHGNAELLRDGVDVVDVEVDEGVRTRITLVFREVKTDAATRDGDEPGKARLELMLPLLLESETLVPGNSPTCILNVENRYYLLIPGSGVSLCRTSVTPGYGAAAIGVDAMGSGSGVDMLIDGRARPRAPQANRPSREARPGSPPVPARRCRALQKRGSTRSLLACARFL